VAGIRRHVSRRCGGHTTVVLIDAEPFYRIANRGEDAGLGVYTLAERVQLTRCPDRGYLKA